MEVRISGEIQDIAGDSDLLVKVAEWVCRQINLQPESIDIILVDDNTLRELHKIYLDDDTVTDVMTFNLGEDGSIESEIYISMPRAISQSVEYGITLLQEMIRLVVHACLHLAGYDDQNDKERKKMKILEDEYVNNAYREFLNSGKNCH